MCATTKKAKACKNCSCGLAEELEATRLKQAPKPDTSAAKSSCGSVSVDNNIQLVRLYTDNLKLIKLFDTLIWYLMTQIDFGIYKLITKIYMLMKKI